jgi:molybdopterin molybdotransferase
MTAVSVAEAIARVLDAVAPQPTLRLPIADAAGHVLARDVIAPWPLPPWTAASMDGYAVRGDDVRGASAGQPITLPLAGGGHAGDGPPPSLAPGTAWRVATGGRVPEGADSVIRQEDTKRDPRSEIRDPSGGPSAVTITTDRDVGRNVRPLGGDVAKGSVALDAGTVVTPGVVALLAALGEATPVVHRRPRVGIITSGDEVVSLEHPEQLVSGERLADVNTPMLAALVQQAGGVAVPIGLLPDDAAALRDAVDRARDVDLLLTAGAVSVGEHDHVPAVMADLGAEMLFRRVRIRPGGPTTLARLPDGRAWLALPGNPVSAFVTFHVFAKPAIRRMMGCPEPAPVPGQARLAEPLTRHPTLDLYLRVTLGPDPAGGPPTARRTGDQGSWLTSSVARAQGLAVLEAGEGEVAAGGTVALVALESG